MKRREFLENTAIGAVLAPILGLFGVETPESGENRPSHGDIRVIGEEDGRLKIEIFARTTNQATIGQGVLPEPEIPTLDGYITTIGSAPEFHDTYFYRVGHEPPADVMLEVCEALEVPPPW